ncbi:sigma-70 family RNA polymerase sigma factor [Ruminococcaceae bacterium OttesenSCG-928-A16]|nr:sigma-70 family RNA polymerase sigma factor [Ruminococcaceae bacterium OttesenSCG-928-A16]
MRTKLEEMVVKAQGGSQEAFLELCKLKGNQVLYVCVKMMGNQHDGEDAAQEVFVKMQKNITKLKEPAAFTVWLNKIIMNACLNLKRAALREGGNLPLDSHIDFLEEEREEFLPSEYVEDKAKREQLLQVIGQLSPKYRRIILMFYYEGLSQKEIADVLETTENAVEHALRRARANIKKQLELDTDEKALGLALPGFVPVLTKAMQYEAETIANNTIVGALLPVASTAAISGATSQTVFKIMITVLLTGVLGAGVVATVLTSAGSPPPSILLPISSSATAGSLSVPQRVNSWLVAEEDLDINEPENTQPVSMPMPLPTPSNPPDIPATSAPAEWQTYTGRVLLQKNSGEVIEYSGSFMQGVAVQLQTATGTVLGQAVTNTMGEYTLQVTGVEQQQEYFLQLVLPNQMGYAFAPGTPAGRLPVTIASTAGYSLPSLAITDNTPPAVNIRFYNQNGQRSAVNPASATLQWADISETTLFWQILNATTGEEIATGSTLQITTPLQTLVEEARQGTYTLQITATDAAGNQTTAQQLFYINQQ